MLRKFVTLDGEITEEVEWMLSPKDRCFYCGAVLAHVDNPTCSGIFGGPHEYVTLINPITTY